jgi:hypothetical protein
MGWLVTQRSKALPPPAPCVLLRGWAAVLAAAAFPSGVVLIGCEWVSADWLKTLKIETCCRGCGAGVAKPGQRRQAQDLLPQGFVGSNPTPRKHSFNYQTRKKILSSH